MAAMLTTTSSLKMGFYHSSSPELTTPLDLERDIDLIKVLSICIYDLFMATRFSEQKKET